MTGNSLIGLLSVDGERFDDKKHMQYMFQGEKARNYRRVLQEKNLAIASYRWTATFLDDLQALRKRIDQLRDDAYGTLNGILLDDFRALKIQYEQAQLKGKAKKRQIQIEDINALKPFHWGYEFDEILETRGGFDVIITNPPWEVFQVYEKEYFQQYDPSIQKKNMKMSDWKSRRKKLLEDPALQKAWLEYVSGFNHVRRYFKETPQYRNQISWVNGKNVSGKINLYSLFVEQCFNLLRVGGTCGIVIPAPIYSGQGNKQLRRMLLEEAQVTALIGFENRNAIFEDVHRSFKFAVLTFEKGGRTECFPAAFMRHDVSELNDFPNEDGIWFDVNLIERTSPSTLSITEFKNALGIRIADKMLRFPLLGERPADVWNVKFSTEFDTGGDSDLFHDEAACGRLPLFQGRMIWQYQHNFARPRFWIDGNAGRKRVLRKGEDDSGQMFGYQSYRLAHRRQASSTNKRTFIASILPTQVFASDSLYVTSEPKDLAALLMLTALANSYACDWLLRQKVDANINWNFVAQLPVPRLKQGDPNFESIVHRAAQLICTTSEFDDLAAEVGLGSHHNGVTDPQQRAKLRAELDGIIAHIYGLTEDEFAYVLSTFPLVKKSVKAAALQAWRDVANGVVH